MSPLDMRPSRPIPLKLAAALLTVAALSACSTVPPGPSAPSALEGSAWMLSTMGAQTLPADASPPTLRFAADRITGSDGCNRFVGPWHAHGTALHIGRDLAVSRRDCSEAVRASAEAYSRVLARTTAWRMEDASLVLADRHGTPLAVFAPQPAGLVDTVWRVTAYAGAARSMVGVLPGSLITVEFDPDGRVRGFGGCSRYAGPWALAERRLNVGPLQYARAGCAGPADLKAQEAAYLKSIGSAAAMRRDGERLELRDANGSVVATAAAVPRTAPISRR